MRRTTISAVIGLGVLAAATAGPAFAGTSSGNGAQKAALSPASSSSPGSCSQGSGKGSNGFAILNKTGAPVPGTSTVQGEVHVVDPSLRGQTVTASLVDATKNNCPTLVTTTITLNDEGIGNGHLSGMEPNGSYYVEVSDSSMNEVLASKAVPLI